ncbi:MAG: SocA family protein [Puniceicoccales bacterium]|nr:SocA family protein [Puniceicoccales bacterium]
MYIIAKVGAKPNVGKTVLCKLLYFINFDYYELYEEQLMELVYVKDQYGPRPLHFEELVKK